MNRRFGFVFLLGALIAIVVGFRLTRPGPTAPATNTAPEMPAATAIGRIADIASRTQTRPPVIFIGLDGADWALLDQYAGRGVMPVLQKLSAEGASGTLETVHPALSPLIWNTMLTGVTPLEHRVLDFLRVNPVSGQREPITSDERKAPAVWNMATAAGKRVAALGFWATYPAEAVNGLLVSDRLFTLLYSESEPPPGVVNPAGDDEWARETLKSVDEEVNYAQLHELLPWLSEAEYNTATAASDPYARPVGALRRMLVETRVYDRMAREYFARAKPDLTVLYIQGTDTVGHVFAPYAPPRQASISAADFDRYSAVAERYFAQIDRMLGEYRKLAESAGAVLVLASDHGFKWTEGRPETLSSEANATAAKWHADNGIYLIWGGGTKPSGGHTGKGGVAQVAATLLALTGMPAAANIAGPPLAGAPAPVGTAVDYARYYSPAAIIAATESAARSKVDQETIDKLRALGYIGADGGGGQAIGTRTGGSFNNEGLLLKAAGHTTDAVEAFESALTVDPNLAPALWNLSELLFAERRSLDKSDALLVRAFANGLADGRRYLLDRAAGYQREGRVDRSLKLLTDAAAAKSDDAEVWLFRGRYRVETGDCPGAVTDFQRAVHLDPANAGAYASLGNGQMCAGDKAGAREAFKRSLSLDPNQPKLREVLRER